MTWWHSHSVMEGGKWVQHGNQSSVLGTDVSLFSLLHSPLHCQPPIFLHIDTSSLKAVVFSFLSFLSDLETAVSWEKDQSYYIYMATWQSCVPSVRRSTWWWTWASSPSLVHESAPQLVQQLPVEVRVRASVFPTSKEHFNGFMCYSWGYTLSLWEWDQRSGEKVL